MASTMIKRILLPLVMLMATLSIADAQISMGASSGGGGGSGTVNTGTTNALGYYAAPGTTISPITACANGVYSTNGSNVPGCGTTLPTALIIPGVASISTGAGAPTCTGGMICFGETTVGTGKATGVDVVYGDNSTHGLLASYNNSVYGCLPISPASVVSGHILTWNGTNGCATADGGAVPSIAGLVAGAANLTTSNALPSQNGTTGTLGQTSIIWDAANTGFQFGGTTVSFPELNVGATTGGTPTLYVRYANQAGDANLHTAAVLATNNVITGGLFGFGVSSGTGASRATIQSPFNNVLQIANNTQSSSLYVLTYVPTITSGFGTSPSVVGTVTNGRVTIGSGGTANTGVINYNLVTLTLTNAPICIAQDETTLGIGVQAKPGTTSLTLNAYSTTTAAATPFGAGDTVTWTCIALP